jgi:hypothetical protein
MRLSVVLLLVSLAGVLGGAALIGLPALGAAVIFDSLCVGVWALARDDGLPSARLVSGTPTVAQALERFRDAA